MVTTLFFVSENKDKYLELKNYLDRSIYSDQIKLIPIKPQNDINEIQSLDRNQIILHKIVDALQSSKDILEHYQNNEQNNDYWIMVEDTSFCIDKQGGFPGPFIKYYLKSQTLSFISNSNWGSPAQSIVTLGIGKLNKNAEVHSQHVFEGIVNGVIVNEQGSNGFGYDSIFRPNGSICTNAAMNMNEKEKFNPRIEGFQKILTFIKPNL
jgi:non-canonical purine NTP pyrophosphatase (RdgB/HAM1 family)